jgi:hypothetical protein
VIRRHFDQLHKRRPRLVKVLVPHARHAVLGHLLKVGVLGEARLAAQRRLAVKHEAAVRRPLLAALAQGDGRLLLLELELDAGRLLDRRHRLDRVALHHVGARLTQLERNCGDCHFLRRLVDIAALALL